MVAPAESLRSANADRSSLAELANAARDGNGEALDGLTAAIYPKLRRVARCLMAHERPGHTLQATALADEAFVRLVSGNRTLDLERPSELFVAAVNCMREILVDYARKRAALKRGGDKRRQNLRDYSREKHLDPTMLLAVNEALENLEELDPRKAQVVMLRHFAGMTVDECAAALDVSPRTVDSEWRFARAWLHRELSKGDTAFELEHPA